MLYSLLLRKNVAQCMLNTCLDWEPRLVEALARSIISTTIISMMLSGQFGAISMHWSSCKTKRDGKKIKPPIFRVRRFCKTFLAVVGHCNDKTAIVAIRCFVEATPVNPNSRSNTDNTIARGPQHVLASRVSRCDAAFLSAGEPVRFAPGELQVEEAKQEAAETRLPTLPLLPAIDHSHYKGTDLEHQQLEQAERGALEALGTQRYEERKSSTLESSAGFYLKCKTFLPAATPEQHFQVFGVSRPLSREEWQVLAQSGQSRDGD